MYHTKNLVIPFYWFKFFGLNKTENPLMTVLAVYVLPTSL